MPINLPIYATTIADLFVFPNSYISSVTLLLPSDLPSSYPPLCAKPTPPTRSYLASTRATGEGGGKKLGTSRGWAHKNRPQKLLTRGRTQRLQLQRQNEEEEEEGGGTRSLSTHTHCRHAVLIIRRKTQESIKHTYLLGKYSLLWHRWPSGRGKL